jgi:hypothetical protein
MKRLINILNNLLDSAISILEPDPGYVEKLKIDQYNIVPYSSVTSLLPSNTDLNPVFECYLVEASMDIE